MFGKRIDRRTVLKGAGAAMALPLLECMVQESRAAGGRRADPPRLACIYVPGGIARPWWYPEDEGRDFTLSPSLEPLANHRDQFTLIRGLQHIAGEVGGHLHAQNWLTGHNVVNGSNTVSMDQVFAQHFGTTYCETLVLSFHAGVGDATASRNALGADIHALGSPAQALRQLLPPVDSSELSALRHRLQSRRTVVDGVNEQLRDFNRTLGHADRQRMDQFAESLHGLETRIGYREQALAVPRPAVDENRFPSLGGNVSSGVGRGEYGEARSLVEHMDIMTDLMVLGFQSDTTRASTYITGSEHGGGPLNEVYEFARSIGLNGITDGHKLWHSGSSTSSRTATPSNDNCGVVLARRDRMLVEGLVRFMDKLRAIPAVEGTLLDQTQILLGGMQGATHRAADGPTLVAGGKRLGWRHGQYKVYCRPADPHGGQKLVGKGSPQPLSNLYLTMLQQAGCRVDSFKESTGPLSDLLG
jgi:hypothetical protein